VGAGTELFGAGEHPPGCLEIAKFLGQSTEGQANGCQFIRHRLDAPRVGNATIGKVHELSKRVLCFLLIAGDSP